MSVRLTKLDNGVRIVTHEIPEFATASVGVWVNAGGRHERADQNGISHFIEHMAFKGTASRSAQEIVGSIEAVGGDLNAATSKEITAYYARVLEGDVSLALDILGDIVLNPVLDEKEFERERNVILQEISASKDSPDDIVYDSMQDVAFPNQAIGRNILGTEEGVKSFQTADLKEYMRAHYSSNRMVIGAAGGVNHEKFVAHCESIFGDMVPLRSPLIEPALYGGGVQVSACDFEQSHLMLAFEGPNYHDQRYYDALVLSGLFGGSMSSRLFQEVRERRGLCYSIYSFAMGYSDAGLFGIHAASSGDKLQELMDVIQSEMHNIGAGGLAQSEVDMAKSQLKAGLLMGLENSMSRAEHLARQVFAFGDVLSTEEMIERVEMVNLERVQELCGDMLDGANRSIAVVGSDFDMNKGELLARATG